MIVGPMSRRFTIRSQEVCVKHVMDAPLRGKFEPVVDRGHHLDNGEWAVAPRSEFRRWLVRAEVAPF